MSTSTSFPTELRLPAPRPRAIDVAAALKQVGGDYEFVMTVMRDEFLAKAPDQIARCVANARLADARVADAAAKDKRDAALKALAFEAHSMKGASATLHADAMSKACHRLERVAKGVPLDALEPDSGADEAPRTFEQRTREMADRFAELEADVADLAAITDVDVAAASEALGSRLGVTLARLAGDAAALAARRRRRGGGGARRRRRAEPEPETRTARVFGANSRRGRQSRGRARVAQRGAAHGRARVFVRRNANEPQGREDTSKRRRNGALRGRRRRVCRAPPRGANRRVRLRGGVLARGNRGVHAEGAGGAGGGRRPWTPSRAGARLPGGRVHRARRLVRRRRDGGGYETRVSFAVDARRGD